MESSRLKETGKAKYDSKKNLEGDFKKMEPTLGAAERIAKERIPWRRFGF